MQAVFKRFVQPLDFLGNHSFLLCRYEQSVKLLFCILNLFETLFFQLTYSGITLLPEFFHYLVVFDIPISKLRNYLP